MFRSRKKDQYVGKASIDLAAINEIDGSVAPNQSFAL